MDTNLKKQQNEKGKTKEFVSSLVSNDLTADACMESFWNDSRRPAPSLVKLKAKATVHHSQLAQAHLQEHAIRLSLQHNLKKRQQLSTQKSDIKAFANAPLAAKISAPTDQFYGTVWEGLPSLPQGANVFNSSPSNAPEYFKVAKKHQDALDIVAKVGEQLVKPVKAKKAENLAKKDTQEKSAQLLIDNLLESFPVHLRPAVVELSNAISCLSPVELDSLVETADWRTRKLIRMVAAAKLSV